MEAFTPEQMQERFDTLLIKANNGIVLSTEDTNFLHSFKDTKRWKKTLKEVSAFFNVDITALNRWKKLGENDPSKSTHIELCRKKVATEPMDENPVRVNYNKNLYPEHDGMIFSEGANFEEDKYVHVKIRDLRLELSIEDFNQIADCFAEAKEKLCQLV
jgi:hypothetical protein